MSISCLRGDVLRALLDVWLECASLDSLDFSLLLVELDPEVLGIDEALIVILNGTLLELDSLVVQVVQ